MTNQKYHFCTNQMIIVMLFLIHFIFVSDRLFGEPIGEYEFVTFLPEELPSIKIGLILNNNAVYSFDSVQTVDVNYKKGGVPFEQITTPTISTTHNVLQWFTGNLDTNLVVTSSLPSKFGIVKTNHVSHAGFSLQWGDKRMSRWCFKDGIFWCIPDLIIQMDSGYPYAGAYNEHFPALYCTELKTSTLVKKINENPDPDPRERYRETDIVRDEWTPAVSKHNSGIQITDQRFQCCSILPPMSRFGVPYYDSLSGGFDFVPLSRYRWRFCTLIPNWDHTNGIAYYPFTVWEAQSRIKERNEVQGYETRWQVYSQTLLSWGGKFFAISVKNVKDNTQIFHLIRDRAPCYSLTETGMAEYLPKSYKVSGELYCLKIPDEDIVDEKNKPWHLQNEPPKNWIHKKINCKNPIFDTKNRRIISIIYLEPEGMVYGFGKDFYMRLDVLPENNNWKTAIVSCHDITEGEVLGKDSTGKERNIGEPFRTVWQCSKILKEAGLINFQTDDSGGSKIE
ncbi:MAG: hypothetical protein LBR26_05095 [Prevotella sp.]|jgi:hypothetical protein|nr:hypothetical protein [Prevotella sp.]